MLYQTAVLGLFVNQVQGFGPALSKATTTVVGRTDAPMMAEATKTGRSVDLDKYRNFGMRQARSTHRSLYPA